MGSGNPESNWKEIRGQEIPKITRKKPADRESQKQWTEARGQGNPKAEERQRTGILNAARKKQKDRESQKN
jgi:hypothetical protein